MLILHSVVHTFRDRFAVQAEDTEPLLYTAGYDHIPIDVHVPVLDIPNLPTKSLPRYLSKAVIQGTFSVGRRNYAVVFRDLIASLHGSCTSSSIFASANHLPCSQLTPGPGDITHSRAASHLSRIPILAHRRSSSS